MEKKFRTILTDFFFLDNMEACFFEKSRLLNEWRKFIVLILRFFTQKCHLNNIPKFKTIQFTKIYIYTRKFLLTL